MRRLRDYSLVRSRYPLAILAGALLAAAFPSPSVAGLAWIAPGLLLLAAFGTTGAEAFRIGYVGGLAHYLGSLHWLLNIPYRWHGIPLAPATGWLALSAFLALFTGAWVWLLAHRLSLTGPPEEPAPTGGVPGFRRLHPGTWASRLRWALGGAAAWVGIEMVLARLFGGFPWNLLGASQEPLTPLLQLASITGVYGVSFLVVWFSLSLLWAGLLLARYPANRVPIVAEIALPALAVAVAFNFGLREINHAPPQTRTLRLTLVQPSIPQTVIWDPASADERFRQLLALSEQALTNETDLFIWPEAAVPKLLRYNKEIFEAVTGLASRHRVWMVVGADDAEPRQGSADKEEADYYNSSFLISPEGRLVDYYRKRSLVMFGEYLPLARWLPFLQWFTPISGGFTPGDRAVQFALPELEIKASVLICFEDIFPHLGRGAVERDTDFLINLTNDGWFGDSAAQWQHAQTAMIRAIETRRPLVRCTNNGLTCWIDAYGRMRDVFRDASGSPYGPGVFHFDLPLPPPDQPLTFFTRHGDWFGWPCVAIAMVWLAWRVSASWREKRTSRSIL